MHLLVSCEAFHFCCMAMPSAVRAITQTSDCPPPPTCTPFNEKNPPHLTSRTPSKLRPAQEMYFRHLYARTSPDVRARAASWDNYCALFGVILGQPLNMQVNRGRRCGLQWVLVNVGGGDVAVCIVRCCAMLWLQRCKQAATPHARSEASGHPYARGFLRLCASLHPA